MTHSDAWHTHALMHTNTHAWSSVCAAAACWLPPVGQILAAVQVSPHETFGLSRKPLRELTALTVSRRNVPNVFAHAPQFTICVAIKSAHFTIVIFWDISNCVL